MEQDIMISDGFHARRIYSIVSTLKQIACDQIDLEVARMGGRISFDEPIVQTTVQQIRTNENDDNEVYAVLMKCEYKSFSIDITGTNNTTSVFHTCEYELNGKRISGSGNISLYDLSLEEIEFILLHLRKYTDE